MIISHGSKYICIFILQAAEDDEAEEANEKAIREGQGGLGGQLDGELRFPGSYYNIVLVFLRPFTSIT